MQTRWVWAMSVLALVTLPAACAPADAPPVAEETLPSGEVAWGYEAEDGPSVWGRLSATYDLCATGSRQSPIDLPADSVREPVLLAFDYHDSAIELVNDGHTIQLTYDAGSGIDLRIRLVHVGEVLELVVQLQLCLQVASQVILHLILLRF